MSLPVDSTALAPDHPSAPRPPGARSAHARRLLIGGAAAIGCAVILLAGPGMSRGQLHTGDTDHLVAGSRAILDCVDRHVFRACSFDASVGRSKVGPYPLLQYLPALAMRELGFRPLAVLRGLAWVNFVAFVVSLGLLASLAARARQDLWRPLLVVLGASGPMWFYATAGFGEMLAATMVLAAVLACLHRRPVLIGVLALVACLGKETFFPFVLALGLLAGRRDEDGWLPPRRVVLPLVLGVAGGAALSFGFNVFRYGTVRNVRYLQPQFRVHGFGRIARNVVELLIAPGGGLALYWPVIALLLIAVAMVGVRALRQRSVRVFGPIAALFVVIAAYTVVLALWWAPFGWIAWGPRLFLPLIPALAVVTIHVGGGPLARARVAGPSRPRGVRSDRRGDVDRCVPRGQRSVVGRPRRRPRCGNPTRCVRRSGALAPTSTGAASIIGPGG